jgi:hypothetical protein
MVALAAAVDKITLGQHLVELEHLDKDLLVAQEHIAPQVAAAVLAVLEVVAQQHLMQTHMLVMAVLA